MKTYPTEYDSLFQKTFGESLRKYFHPIWGFDIIKFDDLLHSKFGYVEDGKTSCADFVSTRFGDEIALMIRRLLKT